MQLDLGSFLRIVEHPVAHLYGTHGRTDRDHIRPGQALAHLRCGRNDDPGLRTPVGRVLARGDKNTIMKKPDRQRSGTHVHTSHAANASHTVDTAGSNTHTPDTTRMCNIVLQRQTPQLSIPAHQHPATTGGPRIPGTNAQTSPDGECTPNGV